MAATDFIQLQQTLCIAATDSILISSSESDSGASGMFYVIVTLFMAATDSVHILFTATTDSVYGCNKLHIRLQQAERAATDSLYVVATDCIYGCNRLHIELQQTERAATDSLYTVATVLQQFPYMLTKDSVHGCNTHQGVFPIKIAAVLLWGSPREGAPSLHHGNTAAILIGIPGSLLSWATPEQHCGNFDWESSCCNRLSV